MAQTPADRATVTRARAERFQVWGFPWEGLVLMRQAQWADKGRRDLRDLADAAQWTLRHPEQDPQVAADSSARR